MRFGLPASFVLHGSIIAFALISLERTKPFKPPEPEPVSVALITEDGLTRLKRGDRNAKSLEDSQAAPAPDSKAVKETPKAKPPEPKAPPPPAEEAKVEPPKPEPPKPDPIADKLAMLPPEPIAPTAEELARQEAEQKAAAKKEADRKAAEKKAADKKVADKKAADKKIADKKAEEKRLAELKKKQSTDELDALEKALKDNDPTKRAPPPPGGNQLALGKKGPAAGAPEGHDTRLTASQGRMLGTLIKQAVSKCWNINTGAEGIEKIVVSVRVVLRPDGTLAKEPQILDKMSGQLFADTANSAVRAVVKCAPYNFPPDLYKGGWEDSDWEFDPRKMF